MEPLAEIVVAYAVKGFGASRGTMRSTLAIMGGSQTVYEDGSWSDEPPRAERASFDFGAPIGRLPVVRYPAGEVITVPRHTRTRRVTTLLTAGTVALHPALAPVVPYTVPAMAMALRTPLRGLLERAIGALPEGPAEEARRAAAFTIVAQARGEDGRTARGVVRGTDVYGLTAAALVHGAETMAGAGYDRAGALGPAAAFDPAAFLNQPRRPRPHLGARVRRALLALPALSCWHSWRPPPPTAPRAITRTGSSSPRAPAGR